MLGLITTNFLTLRTKEGNLENIQRQAAPIEEQQIE